ncbi:MAG TPA: agmatinase, partial [Anaerolineales bacterium]|nr:agmatinase [Anaerolineales bacterium]
AEVAILGIPYGFPYPTEVFPNDQSRAPQTIRRESARLSLGLDRWDFDINGTLAGREVVDCGDVPVLYAAEGTQRSSETVRAILACGARPVIMGGDHSITIPVLRAFDGFGPLTLVQVDAHLDWRDEVSGVREGYSSPIRRAAEMAHIGQIFQIGLRGQGSARQEELQAARDYGAELITAYQVHEQGMPAILGRIPNGGRYYLTIDADGLDPSVMPGVEGPAAGGLSFHQVRALIRGLAQKGHLVGMDIVEITPSRDLNGITALTAGQLVMNFIGAAAGG